MKVCLIRTILLVSAAMFGICDCMLVHSSAEQEVPFESILEKMQNESIDYFHTWFTHLKQQGCFLNQRSKEGYTLLDYAAIKNRADVVQLLLEEFDAHPKILFVFPKLNHISAAFWAAWFGHHELLVCLLEYGMSLADRHPTNGSPLLSHALQKEYAEIIWILLKKKYVQQISLIDMGGNTCLHYCVGEHANYHFAHQILEIAKTNLVVKKKPQDLIMFQNAQGETPLSIAQAAGQEELVALMNSYLPSVVSSVASTAVKLVGSGLRLWS